MRTFATVLLLLVFLMGSVFGLVAQERPDELPGVNPEGNDPSNAVQIDLSYLLAGLVSGGFGLGGAYELALDDQQSAKVQGGFFRSGNIFGFSYTFLDVYGSYRYFLWDTALNGLFFNGGAGVVIATWNSDSTDTGSTSVLPVLLVESGYKWTFGEDATSGFFAEPFAGWRLTLGSFDQTGVTYGGFRGGANLGWAF